MLQTVQKYYRSIIGSVIMFFVLVSMLFFGVDFGGNSQRDMYALKVNDNEVPITDFYKRKRQVEARLRQQLGENYARFAPQFLKNINSNIVEDMITQELYSQFTSELDLVSSETQVREQIVNLFPAGEFSSARYSMFLSQTGTTAPAFEAEIAENAKNQQLLNMLEDASVSSEAEARAMLKDEKTSYDISYVSLDNKDFLKEAETPDENELLTLYEENASEYERPAQVKYQYVVLSPEDYTDIVPLTEEDVEFYYTENIRDYSEPEKVLVKQVRLKLPEKDQDKAREKAEAIRKKIEEGEEMDSLEDVEKELAKPTWKTRGTLAPPLEAAAFSIKDGGITEVVEHDGYLNILSVEDYKPTTPKELEEVKEQVEKDIKLREAPAFTAAKAEELYAKWLEGDSTLEDFASKEKLTVKSTDGLFTQVRDPENLRGLTRKVLSDPSLSRQIQDAGNKSLLIEIAEYKEPHIAPFEEVTAMVTKKYKEKAAAELARKRAEELFTELSEGEMSLNKLEEEKKYTVEHKKDIARAAFGQIPFLRGQESTSKVLAAKKGEVIGDTPFFDGTKHYIAVLTEVTQPKEEEIEKELKQKMKSSSQQLAQVLQMSLRNILKSNAEINVNQAVYAQ